MEKRRASLIDAKKQLWLRLQEPQRLALDVVGGNTRAIGRGLVREGCCWSLSVLPLTFLPPLESTQHSFKHSAGHRETFN